MKAINDRIENYTKEAHTTKAAVARHIGISRSGLYDKITEKTPWTLEEGVNLAKLMGITIDELVTEL